VGAVERPARRDPVAFGDLLLDDELKIGEELSIESDRPACAIGSVVFERIDVIDKAWAVHLFDPSRVLAGADVLKRTPRNVRGIFG
jgi:hypothetical protein